MSFQDLEEFFDPTLRLPIRGKTYVIQSPDATTGLWCQRILEVAAKVKDGKDVDDKTAQTLQLDDDEERTLYERLMGDTYQEMLEDNIPWEYLKHAGTTALLWAAGNVETAETFWRSGGASPEAERPKPQDHKASAKKARPASRGGSTSRKAIVQGEVIPGPSSSPTGT